MFAAVLATLCIIYKYLIKHTHCDYHCGNAAVHCTTLRFTLFKQWYIANTATNFLWSSVVLWNYKSCYWSYRSSHLEVFYKKDIFEYFAKSNGNHHLCWSLFLMKLFKRDSGRSAFLWTFAKSLTALLS